MWVFADDLTEGARDQTEGLTAPGRFFWVYVSTFLNILHFAALTNANLLDGVCPKNGRARVTM